MHDKRLRFIGLPLLTVALSAWLGTALGPASAATLPEASRIDAILAEHLKKQGVQPNPSASDDVFVRRVYLDVIGRIPTLQEVTAFLQSSEPDKRRKLIDALLASPGYASHWFNYFADLLRVVTDDRDRITGQAYADWLKQALRKNQPYDAMVRELVTARGEAWENGAIGFYMRDRGMPLDHLAATVQVFLGTRLECAQCHNHPFDKWTQMDYYQMAAFTYGMDTRGGYGFSKKDFALGGKPRRMDEATRENLARVKETLNEVMKSLRYTQVRETDKLPTLPHDYQYQDAQPHDEVTPATLFGEPVQLDEGESRVEAFAEWLTSPQNPRFTQVIANRLWKQLMGAGVMEPVDELVDSTVPVNADLMKALEDLMMDQRYDLKGYLRVLLNTESYQRMPSTQGLALGELYSFQGPLLRRLTAEQIWDSAITLIRGDVDAESALPDRANAERLESLRRLSDALAKKKPSELLASIQSASETQDELDQQIQKLTEEAATARKAGDLASAKALTAQVNRLRQEVKDRAFVAVLGEATAEAFQEEMRAAGKRQRQNAPKFVSAKEQARELLAEGLSKSEVRQRLQVLKKEFKASSSTLGQFKRACDLTSPAPRGHFLRTFGQSDREMIENANREGSVPQALNLMNGPLAGALLGGDSCLTRNLSNATRPEAQIDLLYLSLLSRSPTGSEREELSRVFMERGDKAWADGVQALLNTSEFLFVQ